MVLRGYRPGPTGRIVAELAADGRQVVLCAWDDVPEHPMPERPEVHFLRGYLTRHDAMTRAAVPRARTAVMDGRDDNETLAIAVAVDHANPSVHMVAELRDLSRRDTLRYVNPRARVVQWHMPFFLTEEANAPGLTAVYNELMSEGGSGNTYSVREPTGFQHLTFGQAQSHFGQAFGATVLAVRDADGLVVSPPWDSAVPEGAALDYVARERIDEGLRSRR